MGIILTIFISILLIYCLNKNRSVKKDCLRCLTCLKLYNNKVHDEVNVQYSIEEIQEDMRNNVTKQPELTDS